ncbi:MAG: adenylate/guanylate cyclase domain-containing protein [Leptolyngbya sp. SIO1E4]|nr:adenylate/guanylate cyclase domain-containing protein [Leptolyngbya sp. SIO1E4]
MSRSIFSVLHSHRGMTQTAHQPGRVPRWSHWMMAIWAAVGAGAIAVQAPWIQRIEGQAQAFLLALRGPVVPPQDIVILAIDEESLSQGDFYLAEPEKYAYLEPLQTWPWQRSAYAEAITKLTDAGARVVALDVLLVTPSVYGPEDDDRLQAVLSQRADQVVLAAAFEVSVATGGNLTQLIQPIFEDTSFRPGLINVTTDPDQRVRALPADTLQQLAAASGISVEMPAFPNAILTAAQIPTVPLQGDHIFFYGPENTFPTVPFWHLLEPQNWALHEEAGTFRDKLVLIGPTANSLQDIKRTPTSDAMPGIEVHAHTLATMIEGQSMAQAFPQPPIRGLVTGLLMAGVGLGLGYRIVRPLGRPVGFAIAAIVWGGIAYLLMAWGYTWIPLAVPVAVLGIGGINYTAAGALSDRLEQQRIRRTLEHYMAPPVVAEILNQPDDYTELVVGKELSAAVLFADIRGFSRLSYQLPAEAMVSLLNTYLEAMVQAIMGYRGTIDKFIGDAVMAEFGSPTSQGAHEDALNAIRAGLAMRRSLAELRQRLIAAGQPALFHGIGISYGKVIAGNIGSVQRLEYTAIGDTVNVASRIEGLTKHLGTDFLITAPLYELVSDDVQVMTMGEHRLAGREGELVKVYSVIGFDDADALLYRQVQQDLRQHLGMA